MLSTTVNSPATSKRPRAPAHYGGGFAVTLKTADQTEYHYRLQALTYVADLSRGLPDEWRTSVRTLMAAAGELLRHTGRNW